MYKKLGFLTAVLVLSTGFVYAEDMKAMPAEPTTEEAAAPVEVGNTICPISGEQVDPATAEKVTVNGKIYNVCKVGKEMFDKDPAAMTEKFAAFDAKMEEEMKEGAGEGAGMMNEDMDKMNEETEKTKM